MGTSADSSRGVAPVLFGFVGREYLPALGLYYFRARFYDPRLGRFLSPDPIGPAVDDPATLDRYAYARNAPTRYGDPLGLVADEVMQWAWETANRGTTDPSRLSPGQRATYQLAWDLLTDISQITFKSTPTVPKFHRHCKSFPSAAIRQSNFGNLAVFGNPFGPVFHHPDTPLPGLDVCPWNVRYWLLADLRVGCDLGPLYP